MGNLPNTKPKEHADSKKPINVTKENHPATKRSAERGAPPSGG